MGASAVTGFVAALLPKRVAAPRCVLVGLQYALMAAPFILLINASPGI
ncbi:hypothetical protein [Streptomyces cinnamoneus]|uniref:Uncharacterized protein n=1 Tax=Streptomyces cinnamoneus TaxID=53446 RepID=A0A918WR70_STRCJ|nr:hypothetical protein [Streptomyces cinnamoneus]GHC72874.1 hypothetical protein GCM10010507_60070 [Streptomyces cinnamoneus]